MYAHKVKKIFFKPPKSPRFTFAVDWALKNNYLSILPPTTNVTATLKQDRGHHYKHMHIIWHTRVNLLLKVLWHRGVYMPEDTHSSYNLSSPVMSSANQRDGSFVYLQPWGDRVWASGYHPSPPSPLGNWTVLINHQHERLLQALKTLSAIGTLISSFATYFRCELGIWWSGTFVCPGYKSLGRTGPGGRIGQGSRLSWRLIFSRQAFP